MTARPVSYATAVREQFPELVSGVLLVDGISETGDPSSSTTFFHDFAKDRLRSRTAASLPEIKAWRKAFARMDLKPTQYRCASEGLLRRLRKGKLVSNVPPLIDLCNSISMAFAIPIAVFDARRVCGHLEVRPAEGNELCETFSGNVEYPLTGEIIFADLAGRAHTRRWTNRQSRHSVVRDSTTTALIVAEALHDTGAVDVERLIAAVVSGVKKTWPSATVRELRER